MRELDERWPDLLVVELDESIARAAGRMTSEHALRAADAVHLASALTVTARDEELVFACWDVRLWDAARAVGFATLPETQP